MVKPSLWLQAREERPARFSEDFLRFWVLVFFNAFYENFAIHLAITRFLKPWKRFLSTDGPC